MTAVLSPPMVFQGLTPSGQPLSGGQLSTYVAGTSTPQATYTDSTQSQPNTNPVILNASGQASVWLDPSLTYKFVLTDSKGNQVTPTVDQIQGSLTASALAAILNNAYTQTPTGFFYSQNGAKIDRFNDRVFIGDATANDGQGPANPVSADWLTLWQQSIGIQFGSLSQAQAAVLTTSAAVAVASPSALLVGTRTFNTAQNGQNAIGLQSIAVNNSPSFTNAVWAHYAEAHRVNNVVNSAIGMELDVTQRGALVSLNPYVQNFGQTVALQLASGAQEGVLATASFATNVMTVTLINTPADNGLILNGWRVKGVGIDTTIASFGTGSGGTGTYNLSTTPGTISSRLVAISPMFDNTAAINIQANPNAYAVGLNFGSNSITGTDGINGGLAAAIQFGRFQGMFWFASSTVGTAQIYSDANASIGSPAIQLGQAAVNFLEQTSGGRNFQVALTTAAVNYVFAQGGTAGQPAVIGALGGDTNVDLDLFCAGTGVLRFGTFTATTFSQTGFITIKDSAGTTRRLMVG